MYGYGMLWTISQIDQSELPWVNMSRLNHSDVTISVWQTVSPNQFSLHPTNELLTINRIMVISWTHTISTYFIKDESSHWSNHSPPTITTNLDIHNQQTNYIIRLLPHTWFTNSNHSNQFFFQPENDSKTFTPPSVILHPYPFPFTPNLNITNQQTNYMCRLQPPTAITTSNHSLQLSFLPRIDSNFQFHLRTIVTPCTRSP